MKAENHIRRKIFFANLTFRKPSQFERIKNEIVTQNQKNLNSNITHVLQRADPAPRRRDRPRGSGRARSENERNDRDDRDERDDRDRKNRGNKKNEKKTVDNQQNEIIREDAS